MVLCDSTNRCYKWPNGRRKRDEPFDESGDIGACSIAFDRGFDVLEQACSNTNERGSNHLRHWEDYVSGMS